MGKFQFVWWRKWIGIKVLSPYPEKGKFMGWVYKWRLCLGFLEIRRWGDGLSDKGRD